MCFPLNKNENKFNKSFEIQRKQCTEEKFIALKVYIIKEDLKISDQISHFRNKNINSKLNPK